MVGKLTTMMVGVVGLPILAQVDPATTAQKLAVGTAQTVLAVVVVAEALALVGMFRGWRKDVATDRESMTELIANNTAVIAQNKDASHRSPRLLKDLKKRWMTT